MPYKQNHTKPDSKDHTTDFCVQLKTALCGPGVSLALPGVVLAGLERYGIAAYLVLQSGELAQTGRQNLFCMETGKTMASSRHKSPRSNGVTAEIDQTNGEPVQTKRATYIEVSASIEDEIRGGVYPPGSR